MKSILLVMMALLLFSCCEDEKSSGQEAKTKKKEVVQTSTNTPSEDSDADSPSVDIPLDARAEILSKFDKVVTVCDVIDDDIDGLFAFLVDNEADGVYELYQSNGTLVERADIEISEDGTNPVNVEAIFTDFPSHNANKISYYSETYSQNSFEYSISFVRNIRDGSAKLFLKSKNTAIGLDNTSELDTLVNCK